MQSCMVKQMHVGQQWSARVRLTLAPQAHSFQPATLRRAQEMMPVQDSALPELKHPCSPPDKIIAAKILRSIFSAVYYYNQKNFSWKRFQLNINKPIVTSSPNSVKHTKALKPLFHEKKEGQKISQTSRLSELLQKLSHKLCFQTAFYGLCSCKYLPSPQIYFINILLIFLRIT